MATLKLKGAVPSEMRQYFTRDLSPLAVSALTDCVDIWSAADSEISISGTEVVSIRGLAETAAFASAVVGRRPTLADDELLGRQTMVFGADGVDYLTYDATMSWSDAFTIAVVMRGAPNVAYSQTIVGMWGALAAAPDADAAPAMLLAVPNGNPCFIFGENDSPVLSTAWPAGWQVVLMSFDGVNRASLKAGRDPWLSRTPDVIPSRTTLTMSHSVSSAGLRGGSIDLVARFNVDLSDAANSETLAALYDMLRRKYEGVLDI